MVRPTTPQVSESTAAARRRSRLATSSTSTQSSKSPVEAVASRELNLLLEAGASSIHCTSPPLTNGHCSQRSARYGGLSLNGGAGSHSFSTSPQSQNDSDRSEYRLTRKAKPIKPYAESPECSTTNGDGAISNGVGRSRRSALNGATPMPTKIGRKRKRSRRQFRSRCRLIVTKDDLIEGPVHVPSAAELRAEQRRRVTSLSTTASAKLKRQMTLSSAATDHLDDVDKNPYLDEVLMATVRRQLESIYAGSSQSTTAGGQFSRHRLSFEDDLPCNEASESWITTYARRERYLERLFEPPTTLGFKLPYQVARAAIAYAKYYSTLASRRAATDESATADGAKGQQQQSQNVPPARSLRQLAMLRNKKVASSTVEKVAEEDEPVHISEVRVEANASLDCDKIPPAVAQLANHNGCGGRKSPRCHPSTQAAAAAAASAEALLSSLSTLVAEHSLVSQPAKPATASLPSKPTSNSDLPRRVSSSARSASGDMTDASSATYDSGSEAEGKGGRPVSVRKRSLSGSVTPKSVPADLLPSETGKSVGETFDVLVKKSVSIDLLVATDDDDLNDDVIVDWEDAMDDASQSTLPSADTISSLVSSAASCRTLADAMRQSRRRTAIGTTSAKVAKLQSVRSEKSDTDGPLSHPRLSSTRRRQDEVEDDNDDDCDDEGGATATRLASSTGRRGRSRRRSCRVGLRQRSLSQPDVSDEASRVQKTSNVHPPPNGRSRSKRTSRLTSSSSPPAVSSRRLSSGPNGIIANLMYDWSSSSFFSKGMASRRRKRRCVASKSVNYQV